MIYYQNNETPSLILVCVKINSDQNLRKKILKMIKTTVVLFEKLTVPKRKLDPNYMKIKHIMEFKQ